MFDSKEPVKAVPGTPFPLTKYVSESFGFKAFMGAALYPKTGTLLELGIHQCSHRRIFTTEEERLFKEIAIRLTDALTNLLMYRNLSNSEEKYNLLVQNSQTGIYVHFGGLLKFVNNRFAEMMGYVPKEIIGRQYWEFIHPEDREMVKEISLARARGEPAPTEYEFRHQDKNGKIVWVHNLPIIIKYQGQTANMGNLVQINDRKQVEEQLKAEREKLEEKLGPIQIDKILEEVLHFIRSSIPTTIEIDKKIDSNSLIIGNQTQVHQILMNLFTNAAHAMEDEGGTLGITLKDILFDKSLSKELDLKSGNYIELAVSDTGIGIPPEISDSIFEPYFTTKDPGEGTGMGLAMVQGIVESYGGKISVNSILEEGTTFTIYLPVTRKRKIQRQYDHEQLPMGTERIMFVDDEAPIAKMGSLGLERLGYQVDTRTSSVEALELFKSKPNGFDLVVTDMTMANMTGDKLAIELMKIRKDIPVILCTGYSKKISDATAVEK
jgi:PAS domain S-box-containing protein